MSLYQTLYFMALVGGMAGLFSWLLTTAVSAAIPSSSGRIPDLIAASFVGLLTGTLTVGFSDRWSGNRVGAGSILAGAGIGLAAGIAGGAGTAVITRSLGDTQPFLARLLSWILVGGLIGLGLGLRWMKANKARVVHAWIGGLAGGAIGGALFDALGSRIPDLTQALGYSMIGVGIAVGITLAPILLRDGVLKFVSSGDPRAQAKLGRAGKEWEIQQGDSCVVGSAAVDHAKTSFAIGLALFIPDATIAPRHAVIFGQNGRFYIARHHDINNQAGLARYLLRVRGRSVASSQELHDGDDILIGRTAVRFIAKERN